MSSGLTVGMGGLKVVESTGLLNMGLHDACETGDYEEMERLLEQGAEVDGENRFERTCLLEAVMRDDQEMAEFLVEKGADVNATSERLQGWTALHEACRQKDPEMVEMLLESGADVDAEWKETLKRRQLHEALSGGICSVKVVQLLLCNMADPWAKDGKGMSAMKLARKKKESWQREELEKLIKQAKSCWVKEKREKEDEEWGLEPPLMEDYGEEQEEDESVF